MYDIAYSFWQGWLYDLINPATESYQFLNWTFSGTQLIQLVSIASCLLVIVSGIWVVYKLLCFVLGFANRW